MSQLEISAPVFVIGHRNPDTDSIVAAIGYAWLLHERDKLDARPARAGQLNPQTEFALSSFGLEAPVLLADASTRFRDVADLLEPLAAERPLREAWTVVAQHRVAPVVDAERRPIGMVTVASLLAHLGGQLAAPASEAGELTLGQSLASPCAAALERDVPRFATGDRVRDVLPRILRDERDEFWVVDGSGAYAGICHKLRLLRPPRVRLILIDHNETGQAIAGIDEAELLEVLDHHRLANPPTHMPIAFHVDPVGSSSTLVAERAMRSSLTVPRAIAGALLSGLVSDTLLLRSPTTTPRDRVAAMQLAAWAFPDGADPYAALQDYGLRLLAAGAGLGARPAASIVASDYKSIVASDYKEYEGRGLRFAVAQVELTDLNEVEPRAGELQQALGELETRQGLAFALLMVTDVVRGDSVLLTSGLGHRLDGLPYAHLEGGRFLARGVVSRKKQLLPAILDVL
jgi:manganese-dependent inorganic pyrophosphatase